jgi:hypothetical protein
MSAMPHAPECLGIIRRGADCSLKVDPKLALEPLVIPSHPGSSASTAVSIRTEDLPLCKPPSPSHSAERFAATPTGREFPTPQAGFNRDSPEVASPMSSFVSLSLSTPSTPRPYHVPLNDNDNDDIARPPDTATSLSSSMRSANSSAPSMGLPSNHVNEWGVPQAVTDTDQMPSSTNGFRRKKSTSRLLVSNLGRGLSRVGSVMRRNTSDSAVPTHTSLSPSLSLSTSTRSKASHSALSLVDQGGGSDASGSRRNWIKRRLRAATLPDELTAARVNEEDEDEEEERDREKSWEVSTTRKTSDADDGDEDITRPFNVKVSAVVNLLHETALRSL